MKETNIQWCHSTINPVMGCPGCELWSSPELLRAALATELVRPRAAAAAAAWAALGTVLGSRSTAELYRDREVIAAELVRQLQLEPGWRGRLVDVLRREYKCYAGLLGIFRAGHQGYASSFEQPETFPGRMAAAANWGPPTARERSRKPWLRELGRLIFISDMGDALAGNISFEYLQQEIIQNVATPAGRQHRWLWVTKRPARMADFAAWLGKQNVRWPENLVPLTTVTGARTLHRVADLRRVPAGVRGLSLEPLFEPVPLDLAGIDWVIVGGGSDVLAAPFHIEWALALREQCRRAQVAFFFKQLGRNPWFDARPFRVPDLHGGAWDEWLPEWRVREMPAAFVRPQRNGAAS